MSPSHSSGLAKTILQGTVKGGRRQGGQRKRWEDNIRECTGLKFGKSQRAVENREKWRKLVAKSSVVPQRPSRLRDWWWWWWWCCDSCLWHKVTEFAHSFLFCVRFRLNGLFISISFHKFSRQLCVFSLCSSRLISALLVLSNVCLFFPSYFCLIGPFKCMSVLPVVFLPYWSFQMYVSSSRRISALLVLSSVYHFMKVSLSSDIILCGWLGLKHQLTKIVRLK